MGGKSAQALSYLADLDHVEPVETVQVKLTGQDAGSPAPRRARPAWVTHQLNSQTMRSQLKAFRSAVDNAVAKASAASKLMVDG